MNWHDELRKSPLFHGTEPVREMDMLYPPFRVRVELLLKDARAAGLPAAVFETFRSAERQASLFRLGRTKLRSNGMHHYGVACDVVFLDGDGHFTWNAASGLWEQLGAAGKKHGLCWGGDWKGFRDCPHFQLVPESRAAQEQIIRGMYP